MQRKNFLIGVVCTVLWLLANSPVAGQNFQYNIKVDEVDFLAPAGLDNHKISMVRDYHPNPPITEIAWKAPNDQTPVAFVSGTSARVTAKFVGCDGITWVKGDGPGNYDPPPAPVSNSFYSASLPAFTAGKTDFYEPFEITWYVSRNQNGPWIEVGKSQNPLYVIYSQTPITNLTFFHSLLYYGCKHGKDMTSQNAIVDAIYNNTFSSRTLPRKDSPTKTAMSYWAWPHPQGQGDDCFSTQSLLRYENGRCGAWARFFDDIIKSQGIIGSQISVVTWPDGVGPLEFSLPTDINNFFGAHANSVKYDPSFDFQGNPYLAAEFFVNNWNFSSNKFYLWDREWMPYNLPTNPVPLPPPNTNILTYAPSNGASAQGNDNPMSTFADHGIVKYNNKYYDPSYGTSAQSSKNDWENVSLAGFGNGRNLIYYHSDGSFVVLKRIMWLHETNTSTLQSKIDP